MSIKDPTSSPILPRSPAPLGNAAAPVAARPAAQPPSSQPAGDKFDAQANARKQDVAMPGASSGVVITAALREKLAPYLKERPKKGFGYIIAQGDVLDQLLEEAYEDTEDGQQSDDDKLDKWLEAFLLYNRHLGLETGEALQMAVGQLLFFPELNDMLELHSALAEHTNPLNFPAIEAFLKVASLPAEASAYFHFVQGRGPNPAPGLALRAEHNDVRRGLGKRTKRWKTENVPTSMSRMARTAGATVLSLVEDARNLRANKPSLGTPRVDRGLADEEN